VLGCLRKLSFLNFNYFVYIKNISELLIGKVRKIIEGMLLFGPFQLSGFILFNILPAYWTSFYFNDHLNLELWRHI